MEENNIIQKIIKEPGEFGSTCEKTQEKTAL